MDLNAIKEKLKTIEKIGFSKHFYEPKVQIRNIQDHEIINSLKNPGKLIGFDYQGEDEKGEKYALLFNKSNKYDLRLIISIKDKSLNVITSHIQNIKRRKVLEQWLKKRR
jgi:hypothetical protein